MRDLFGAPRNGHHYLKPIEDEFGWVCGMFSDDGAVITIIKANENELKTFYPIRFNGKGEPSPLWRNYLFLEWREQVTLNVCRSTSKFIKIISAHDENGILFPVLVRREAVAQSMEWFWQENTMSATRLGDFMDGGQS
jgi:hypothetical protein